MTPTYFGGPHTRAALFLTTICILLLGFGCILSPGDKDKDKIEDEPEVGRGTPEVLLEEYLEDAYSRQDSTAYERMLDSRYEFELLPDSVDVTTVETWDRAEDLRIAGRMFSGWTNPEGIKVLGIDLEMSFQAKTVSTDFFQDQPDGQTWYRCVTEVDLKVITQDPTANDGSGIINRVVFSNQDFIVRPDADDADQWTIRRQIDREPIS